MYPLLFLFLNTPLHVSEPLKDIEANRRWAYTMTATAVKTCKTNGVRYFKEIAKFTTSLDKRHQSWSSWFVAVIAEPNPIGGQTRVTISVPSDWGTTGWRGLEIWNDLRVRPLSYVRTRKIASLHELPGASRWLVAVVVGCWWVAD